MAKNGKDTKYKRQITRIIHCVKIGEYRTFAQEGVL